VTIPREGKAGSSTISPLLPEGLSPLRCHCAIDSQSVKTTEAGGERGFDGGKQVKGRKRQLVVDTEGNLLTVAVQPANVQDRDGAEEVLYETQERCPDVTHAWADQSYAGDFVERAAKALGITVEIVRRPKDQVGFVVLPRQNANNREVVSNFASIRTKIAQYRAK
jgi:transposase